MIRLFATLILVASISACVGTQSTVTSERANVKPSPARLLPAKKTPSIEKMMREEGYSEEEIHERMYAFRLQFTCSQLREHGLAWPKTVEEAKYFSKEAAQSAITAHDFLLRQTGRDPGEEVHFNLSGRLYSKDDLAPDVWEHLRATEANAVLLPAQFESVYREVCAPAYMVESNSFDTEFLKVNVHALRMQHAAE